MTKFNLDKLREVAEPRKERPDFMEKNKMNAIDYWYQKYLKEKLTWKDICNILNIFYNYNKELGYSVDKYGTKEYFTEILNRFNKNKEK